MVVNRLGSNQITNSFVDHTNKTYSNIAKKFDHVSNPQATINFKEIGEDGNIERVVDMRSNMSKTNTYNNIIKVEELRINTISESIGNIIDIAKKQKEHLMLKRGPSGKYVLLEQLTKNNMGNLKDQLNVNINGRYLFSGARTKHPPIEGNLFDLSANINFLTMQTNDSYYLGDYYKYEFRTDDNENINYGITAGDKAFQDTIAMMHLSIAAEKQDSDELAKKMIMLL